MRRPDVDRMLSEIPSQTYTDWIAYEHKNGRLDDSWTMEALANLDLHVQELRMTILQANSEKGKTKFKPERMHLPWEDVQAKEEAKKKAVTRSGQKHEKSKNDFYKSLAERNKRKGITKESIEASKAKRAKKTTESTKAGETSWRLQHH